MSKTYETGHAKSVANFETLIAYLTGYGALYNPSNPNIQLNNLKQKAAEARTITEQVNEMIAKSSNAIAIRNQAFEPLKKLSTRIVNATKAIGVTQQVIENIAANNRKIQGQRASAKLTEEEKQKLAATGTIINQISASQQSFDSLLNTLDKQIKLLNTIPQYAPNEVELQQATLTSLHNDLLQKNRDVISKTSELSTHRLNRDNILYHAETGMIALAIDAKNYAKSIFGASNPQYKQISGIPFKVIKV